MGKHYAILYCDPPWAYDRKVGSGIAQDHYKTMNIGELCELPVGEIADKDSILFLWATFPMLKEALALIERWGFRYKTCAFNWVKRNKKADSYYFGLGFWTRTNSEVCLSSLSSCISGSVPAVPSGTAGSFNSHLQTKRLVPCSAQVKRVNLSVSSVSVTHPSYGLTTLVSLTV